MKNILSRVEKIAGKIVGVSLNFLIFELILPRSQQSIKDLNEASKEAGLGKAI
jgi:hypothetical protein